MSVHCRPVSALPGPLALRTLGPGIAWIPALALLAILVLDLLWLPLLRATYPAAIAYNEGWNTYWQQAAAAGRPLYAEPPGWTIENYPPLSFHLIGWLAGIFGDINMTGRAVALLSLGLVCTLAGVAARQVSGSRPAGWYAALCPIVWIGVFASNRIAMNDPQFLGMVFELSGFCIYARWPTARWSLLSSALLFTLAVFTKHNLIAAPIAVAADLLLVRQWFRFIIWAGTGVAFTLAATSITCGIDGPFFLRHLLSARVADYATGMEISRGYIHLFASSVIVGGLWSFRHLRCASARPLALAWAAATMLGLLLVFGHGVDKNIFFEALVFNGMVAAVALNEMVRAARPVLPAAMLAMIAAWPVVMVPAVLGRGAWELAALPNVETEFAAGVAAIGARSGPAWCENLLLCNKAGKPMTFDAYFTSDQIQAGRLAECDLLRQLVAQVPSTIEIGKTSPDDPLLPAARSRFTSAFMQVLLRYYTPVLTTSTFYILAPSDGPWTGPDACV